MTTGTFTFQVAGVTALNPDGVRRHDAIALYCRAGQSVNLRREPHNRHDPDAIGIWIAYTAWWFFARDVQIGYVPAEHSHELAHHLDAGNYIDASILKLVGGTPDKPSRGVTVKVIKTRRN